MGVDFKSIIEGVGLGAAPWVVGLFLLWMAAKWAVKTDLLGWPARSRRQKRADLADSYEKMKAFGPISEAVRGRVYREMLLVAEGGPGMWSPSSTAAGMGSDVEAEVGETDGDEDDVPWRELMVDVGVPRWMIALHRIAGLGAAALGIVAVAFMVGFAFWLPWVMFETGVWQLAVVLALIPLALVRSGLLSLAKLFPERFGFIGRASGAWIERTKRVRIAWSAVKAWMSWQAGPIFVLGAGTMLLLSSGELWTFAVAFFVAALWAAKSYVEKIAIRRAESDPRFPLDDT